MYTFRGKQIGFTHERIYANLDTGNAIKNAIRGTKHHLPEGYVVIGTPEQVAEFVLENDPNRKPLYTTSDIELLDVSELNSIQPFSLAGLSAVCRVVKCIDGDTVRLAFFVPLSHFTTSVKCSRDAIVSTFSRLSLNSPKCEPGFFTCFNVRLLGIDFAESKTEKGKIGTKLMCDLYAENDNIVIAKFEGMDRYGRPLANLYDREGGLLNTKFLNFVPRGFSGPVVLPYDGGKKKPFN